MSGLHKNVLLGGALTKENLPAVIKSIQDWLTEKEEQGLHGHLRVNVFLFKAYEEAQD